MARTWHFHYPGLIPGWGTKILQAVQRGQKKKKKEKEKEKKLDLVTEQNPTLLYIQETHLK